MEDKKKDIYCKRRKIPFTMRIIISAAELEDIEDDLNVADARVVDLERENKRLLISTQIYSKINGGLIHQNLTMKGRLPAPLCPKCNKPKIAGGIQWIDHAECYAAKENSGISDLRYQI